MRLLYARVGKMHCTKCGQRISNQSVDAICLSVLRDYASKQIVILSPVVRRKKGTYEKVFEKIRQDGYSKVRVNGQILNLSDEMEPLDRQKYKISTHTNHYDGCGTCRGWRSTLRILCR